MFLLQLKNSLVRPIACQLWARHDLVHARIQLWPVKGSVGVIEIPSPELTRRNTVSHSGASCTIFGRNPSVSQSAIVLSQANGPRSLPNCVNQPAGS
jgi:hypothetical protein